MNSTGTTLTQTLFAIPSGHGTSLIATVYGAFLGAVFASFYGVVAERVPLRRSINGRSQCSCGRQLKATENIPVLGWLSCGGITRCCGSTLPVSYLLGELAGILAGSLIGLVSGLVGIVFFLSVWGLAVTRNALRHRAILDAVLEPPVPDVTEADGEA